MQAANKQGECEYCGAVADLFPHQVGSVNDLMCKKCLADEESVKTATQVVETSRQNDTRIEIKSDIMLASSTAFIELSGAIHNNPAIEDKKAALVAEAVLRLQKMDEAIFVHNQAAIALANERLAWLKNTQALIATLRADQQAKYSHLNNQYKPTKPTIDVIKGKSPKSTKPAKSFSPSKSVVYSKKDITAACEKHGLDEVTLRMMTLSPSNKGLSLEQIVQKAIQKSQSL